MASKKKEENSPIETCGIVMPMSSMGELSDGHWREVKRIIKLAVQKVGFTARIVSEADDANIFVKSIVQNLYFDPIVVCDVSCKNPNVMFELGMRLAFDKPTVIIVDDKTGFTSDIQGIKHLIYPRDLRYEKIVQFKHDLGELVKATLEESKKPDYISFLKNYERITPSKVESTDVTQTEFIEKKMNDFLHALDVKLAVHRDTSFKRKIVADSPDDSYFNDLVNSKITSAIKKYGSHVSKGAAYDANKLVSRILHYLSGVPKIAERMDSSFTSYLSMMISQRIEAERLKYHNSTL